MIRIADNMMCNIGSSMIPSRLMQRVPKLQLLWPLTNADIMMRVYALSMRMRMLPSQSQCYHSVSCTKR